MRRFHDPVTVLKTVAGPVIGGLFGMANKPKTPKMESPEKVKARETAAARSAAEDARAKAAAATGRDAAIGAMASLGGGAGTRRTLLGVN